MVQCCLRRVLSGIYLTILVGNALCCHPSGYVPTPLRIPSLQVCSACLGPASGPAGAGCTTNQDVQLVGTGQRQQTKAAGVDPIQLPCLPAPPLPACTTGCCIHSGTCGLGRCQGDDTYHTRVTTVTTTHRITDRYLPSSYLDRILSTAALPALALMCTALALMCTALALMCTAPS